MSTPHPEVTFIAAGKSMFHFSMRCPPSSIAKAMEGSRMNYTAIDPDYAARVKESFSRQGFMTHLRAQLSVPEPGACDISIPFAPAVSQQHGYFHGGVVG